MRRFIAWLDRGELDLLQRIYRSAKQPMPGGEFRKIRT